jgi:hypothetical protein
MAGEASSVIAAGVNPKHITSVIADIRDRFISWPLQILLQFIEKVCESSPIQLDESLKQKTARFATAAKIP